MKCGFYINNNFVEKEFDSEKLEYFKKLSDLLKVQPQKDFDFVRVGTPDGDGGYMMADNFKSGRIAYSFGINDNADWENDIANRGYEVFMYDHTIDKLPLENENFHFFKEGISAIDSDDGPLKTLEYYIKRNNHSSEQKMILKLDVEGYEWGVFETVNEETLKQFEQIVVEFHNLLSADEKILKILDKINKTHNLVYSHKNDFGITLQLDDITIPNVLEVTYLK